ncbi:hypothetical protein [Synechococcus sp. PCC 7336]|nr:hypothetical protein [Synechococcus sp. PCC 7336]
MADIWVSNLSWSKVMTIAIAFHAGEMGVTERDWGASAKESWD